MRSSYTTFFQFYIGLLIVSVFIFHGLYFSLITVMFLVRVLLATILLLVIFRIKFLKIERDKIKVTNVLGRSIYIGNKEIQGFGRLYFQICWISLGNGKKNILYAKNA
jgi:amino acid transporter